MITLERLQQILNGFPRLTIGLVGDLFLDRYLEIEPNVRENSIETDLEAYQITGVRNQPGALGTVMNNLAALGVGQLVPVTVVGDDGHGFDLLRSLRSLPVDTRYIIQRPDRLTPTYTKPIRRDENGQVNELNRLDVRNRAPLSRDATQQAIANVKHLFEEADGIIVLDQINEPDWGIVNREVRDVLQEISVQHSDMLIFVDSRAQLAEFRFGILKGNESEFRAMHDGDDDLGVVLEGVRKITGCSVFCTRGESGMLVVTADEGTTHVPGFPVTGPLDIVGAGDSATAGIVASLLSGANPPEAAMVANLVGSITVAKLGTTGTATPLEVQERYQEIVRIA